MTDKPAPSAFDLDAILGELTDKPLTYKGRTFTLPGEFPADCLTPFLTDDLGLVDLLIEVMQEAADTDEWDDLLVAALKKAPTMPKGLLAAAGDAFRTLLGDTQHAEFVALRPSVQAYLLLARGVITDYGLGLTDFFGSAGSSETDAEPSKPTSPTTTPEAESPTSATPSVDPTTPASSD